jgi:prevent-host-death family protein
MQLTAIEFQTKCLEIMDQVMDNHEEVIITKYGKPAVKLIPVEEETPRSFGYMKGSVKIKGDIIASIDDVWDAEE